MQIIYETDNKTAKLEGVDNDLIPFFTKLLSFKKEGVEYSPAYKNYLQYIEDKHFDENARPRGRMWDGVTRLLTKKLKFPCGLVEEVSKYATESLGQTVEILDMRSSTKKDFEIDISERLKELDKVPRDYQEEAVKAVLFNKRGIIKGATGCGKTLIAAMAVAALGKKANIYVIGIDLLDSFYETFSEILPFKIGRIGDGICEIEDVNIVSIWTAGRALGMKDKDIIDDDILLAEKFDHNQSTDIIRALKRARVHILDECHIATCATISQICDSINSEHMYGLSGTPFRMDNADILIKGMIGEVIINIPASKLIKTGVLSKPIIKFLHPKKKKLSGKTYKEIYTEYIIDNEDRNQMILDSTKDLIAKGYKVLVLFNNIKHGDILSEMFSLAGVNFEILSGKDDSHKRLDIKHKMMNGEIDCILASRIFDIGIDIPILSGLVLAGAGKSFTRTMQRIGRVIRKYPGKKHSAIVEFMDVVKYLSNHSKIRLKYYQSEEEFKVIGLI